jgi:hypothetical protein
MKRVLQRPAGAAFPLSCPPCYLISGAKNRFPIKQRWDFAKEKLRNGSQSFLSIEILLEDVEK